MKKLFFATCMFFGFALAASAQTPPKVVVMKQKVAKHEKSNQMEAKPGVRKGDKMTKADGTPDMRFKENKMKKQAVKPAKKDGTPDMRYKVNKGNSSKKEKEIK